MDIFQPLTMDQMLYALILTGMLREAMVFALPDAIAGPGGWLINTAADDE